jgi:hypothetical protein
LIKYGSTTFLFFKSWCFQPDPYQPGGGEKVTKIRNHPGQIKEPEHTGGMGKKRERNGKPTGADIKSQANAKHSNIEILKRKNDR